MLRCRRVAPDDSGVDTVNILHASPDIGSASAEMEQITNFMK